MNGLDELHVSDELHVLALERGEEAKPIGSFPTPFRFVWRYLCSAD